VNIILVLLSIGIVPLGLCYAVNTLFGTNIVYNFESWYSCLFLCIVVRFLITPVVIQQTSQIIIPPSNNEDKDELPKTEA